MFVNEFFVIFFEGYLRIFLYIDTNKFYFIGLFNLTCIVRSVKSIIVNMEKW
jgi:hypothetical protein